MFNKGLEMFQKKEGRAKYGVERGIVTLKKNNVSTASLEVRHSNYFWILRI